MLPTSISEATISSAVITVRTIFSALVTCSILLASLPGGRRCSWMIGEIGCGLPFGPRRDDRRFATESRLAGVVGLDREVAPAAGCAWSWVSSSLALVLAEVCLEFVQRLGLADEARPSRRAGSPSSLPSQRVDFGLGRVVVDRDPDFEAVADLVALGLGRLEDRDQDAEQDHGDDRGDDRRHARRAVAAQRPECLWMKKRSLRHQKRVSWLSWPLVWPSGPTPISARIRRPNSVVDSSV